MLDFVSDHSVSNLRRLLLCQELGAMAAKEHDSRFFMKLLLEIVKVWEHMEAMDAAIRPEIHYY